MQETLNQLDIQEIQYLLDIFKMNKYCIVYEERGKKKKKPINEVGNFGLSATYMSPILVATHQFVPLYMMCLLAARNIK